MSKNPIKQRAGKLGGAATVAKHGTEHMQQIGLSGARVTWSKYKKVPYGQTQYALVNRATGEIIKILDQ